MTDLSINLLGLLALLVLDFLVVSARVSLLNAGLTRLMVQGADNEPGLRVTLELVHAPARLQASLNFVQNVLRFLMAGLVLLISSPLVSNLAGAILLLAGVATVLFMLEWGVRGLVMRNTEAWALRLAPLARGLVWVSWPLVWLPLAVSGDKTDPADRAGSVMADELKELLDAGQEKGVLELGERKMIFSIFELGDTLAREIMIPRIDIYALDVLTPLTTAVDALLETGYTRVPVYEDTVDRILGLVYAKDLLRVWREGGPLESLRELVRPAYYVPEAKKADELLAEMQSQRIHMAIVVDEYGGVAGLVTLEDIVEEILGEIQDEYDQKEEMPYQELPDGEYLFLGKIDVDDFNEVMESKLPKDEADTLGGFIYSVIGRVPVGGEKVQVEGLLLTVEQVTGRRIRKVRARRITSTEQDEEPITHADR